MSNADIAKKLKKTIKRQLNRTVGSFGKIEKKVVFTSYGGKQYSDNPRFISEKMHELYPDYRLVWGSIGAKKLEGIPNYAEVYPIRSWRFLRERATAAAYISNEAMTEDLYKRKGQMFIQTWHGDRGIKKILYDSLEARGISPDGFGLCDEVLTDLFIIGSNYAEERIKTAFRYSGQTLKNGCPRNDCLIHPKGSEQVRKRIGITQGQKVLLYAPTLRRNSKVVQGTVNLDETLYHLAQKGGDWVCLVRAHPKSLGLELHTKTNIIDVSKYPDMSDLLMIADALITDYSSCAGDFILRKKLVLLAQFDLEQYMEEDRTFHTDINEIGYLVAKNQEELNSIIDTMTDQQFADNCEQIMRYFGVHETGHSAEDVCCWINENYNKR